MGNPGGEYSVTYHNIGFIALDLLCARFHVPGLSFDKKSNSDIVMISTRGEDVCLCKPRTYMNLSGDAVAFLSRYYKIKPEDILVIYDDIDIEKGTVRARLNGSAGTHNGMRDIVAKLSSMQFARVRIGTGFKPPFMGLADYVLSRMTDVPLMQKACGAACDFTADWIYGEPWQTLTVTVKE